MGAVCCKSCRSGTKTYAVPNDVVATQRSQPQPVATTSTPTEVSSIQNAVQKADNEVSAVSAFATFKANNNSKEDAPKENEVDFFEKVVCKETDLDENEMNEIDFMKDQKILLIKQSGRYYAVGAKCAHYGAPLIMGSLGDKRIRCPWHGACFSIETGDIEEFPGLDSLPCYEVKVENGEVRVRGKKSNLEKFQIMRPMATRDPNNEQTFVVIGGGPSGQTCVETLRMNDFKGRIIMICKERHLPYDRVKISKDLSVKMEDIQLRSLDFYDECQIEVLLNTEAVNIDTTKKQIMLSVGNRITYNKVYIATGSRPKKPRIPGMQLRNIFTLRTFDNAQEINTKLNSKQHVVILGSSFIALEMAAYCVDKVANVTIVGRSSVPFLNIFGEVFGRQIMELFKSKNVHFMMENDIKSFLSINQENYVSAVKLRSGEFLKADICVIATGSKLNTALFQNSGININRDGSINTNQYLQTNAFDVYAGGDIANSPVYINNDELMTIGHYAVAQYHGKVAALNMLGKRTKLKTVPYFFTRFFEHSISYTGYGGATSIFLQGSLKDIKFSIIYFNPEDDVVGILSCQPNNFVSDFAEKMTQGVKIKRADLFQHFGIRAETVEPFARIKELGEDFIEERLCEDFEMGDNEMREFTINGDDKVLLIKQEGMFYATGTKCAHYGAPLVTGSLGEKRIRCPWHGACFNIETGDIEEFPGLDALPCYQVKVDNGEVRVRARKSQLKKDKIIKPMAKRDPRNGDIFVVIGGGPSGQVCVETLRQNGFMGRIILICKENHLPYDRVKISKSLNSKIEDIQLRSNSFYDENSIEVMLNVEATAVNTKLKEITLSCGNQLKYDKLYIATGSRSKQVPNIPGSNLNNIYTLRSIEDAKRIDSKMNSQTHFVILGSSFIAMEVAAYYADKVASITVVGRSSVPLLDIFGEVIGTQIMEFFKKKNVSFVMESGISSFAGNNEDVESVELSNGKVIWADVCLIAIGSELNTEFLKGSDVKINENGSIDTNLFLETNVRDVFVGGDIANSPVFTNNNERSTIGHYALAQYHGKVAALNMLGQKFELRAVPYFFTLLFDYCFTFTGNGAVSEIFVDGDVDEFKFAAFYFDEAQNVVAMSSCQPDKGISDFAEKLSQGYRYHRDDIEWAIELEDEDEEAQRI